MKISKFCQIQLGTFMLMYLNFHVPERASFHGERHVPSKTCTRRPAERNQKGSGTAERTGGRKGGKEGRNIPPVIIMSKNFLIDVF